MLVAKSPAAKSMPHFAKGSRQVTVNILGVVVLVNLIQHGQQPYPKYLAQKIDKQPYPKKIFAPKYVTERKSTQNFLAFFS